MLFTRILLEVSDGDDRKWGAGDDQLVNGLGAGHPQHAVSTLNTLWPPSARCDLRAGHLQHAVALELATLNTLWPPSTRCGHRAGDPQHAVASGLATLNTLWP